MENTKNLVECLESILFVSGEPIRLADISSKLETTDRQLKNAIAKLEEKYSGESGIILKTFGDKVCFSTNPHYTNDVSLVLNPIRERALSKSTIETLAIIAYKQPITRLEIEEVRGVSCDYAVSILMEHNLIEIVGKKDAVGRPALFGTTDEFLKHFNLKSLEDLPDRTTLLDRIKTIRETERDSSLYRQFDVSTEEIIPDAIKEQHEREKQELKDRIEAEKRSLGITDEDIANRTESDDFV